MVDLPSIVDKKYISSLLEINLARLSENYKILQRQLKKAICGAVVKADAYGVGMIPVAEHLAEFGCEHFFVANIDEAIILRKAIKQKKIYILHGVLDKEAAEIANKFNITPVLNDLYQIELWNNLGKSLSKKLPAVLHFDTGMGRLAIHQISIEKILDVPSITSNIIIEYIQSHLACPEQKDHPKNQQQLQLMQKYSRIFKDIPVSLVNSSGIFLGYDYQFDLVRPGCALYGMNPTPYQPSPIKQVLTLKAGVLQKHILAKRQTIGYGATYHAKKGDRLLTLEVGYADGYFRKLSNKGFGSYQGKYLPVVGRVSMDMVIVNANSLSENEFNNINYVELLGDHITVDTIAKLVGTIGYEVLTSLGNRYKRVYIR